MILITIGILLCCLLQTVHASENLHHFIELKEHYRDSSPDEEEENEEERLYTVASHSFQARIRERSYYTRLYTKILQDFLKVLPKIPHPDRFLSLSSVYEDDSYTLKLYTHEEALLHKIDRIRITIDQNNKERPYNVAIPLLHIDKRSDIRVSAPCSYQEAYGEMSYALADITKFTSENRKLDNKKMNRNALCFTGLSFTGCTAYFLYYAITHALPLNRTIYYALSDVGASLTLLLGLQYRRLRLLDSGMKKDHRDIENRVVSCTKTISVLEPTIATLARTYAQYRLKKHITYLSRRKLSGWLCCRPLLGSFYDYFKKPLEETIPQRISSLLEKFHRKLSAELHKEDEATRFINYSYQSLLISLHELQPTNIPNIIEQSALYEENLSHQQLESLKKNIDNTRETLMQCLHGTMAKFQHNIVFTPDDQEEIR